MADPDRRPLVPDGDGGYKRGASDRELHDAVAAVWLQILKERHPDIHWVLAERERWDRIAEDRR